MKNEFKTKTARKSLCNIIYVNIICFVQNLNTRSRTRFVWRVQFVEGVRVQCANHAMVRSAKCKTFGAEWKVLFYIPCNKNNNSTAPQIRTSPGRPTNDYVILQIYNDCTSVGTTIVNKTTATYRYIESCSCVRDIISRCSMFASHATYPDQINARIKKLKPWF